MVRYAKKLSDRYRELSAQLESLRAAKPLQNGLIHGDRFLSPSGHESETQERPSPRYLGVSSGMVFARTVITKAKKMKVLMPDNPEESLYQEDETENNSLVSQILPPPSTPVPPKEAASKLFDIYIKTEPQYRVIDKVSFDEHVASFFHPAGNASPQTCLVVNTVFAISTLSLGRSARENSAVTAAEGYYSTALRYLPLIINQHNIAALEAVLLVLHFSLINPQQAVVWHLLGFAIRLCVSLGIYSEHRLRGMDVTTLYHLRTLFWVTYSS